MAELTELLDGRKHAYADLGDVLVLGAGVSGRAAIGYLEPLVGTRVRSLTVLADEEEGKEALSDGARRFDLCIASPGISVFSDFYKSAQSACAAVISEVEFAWCESASDAVWAAITGTNGKTTTTALLEHLLNEAGMSAKAVGNIGDACITQVGVDIAEGTKNPYYVVEASSYQLASVKHFAPDAAVVLGITPDHIKWHKTHEHYAASKLNLLANLAAVADATAILDATNDEVRAKVRELKGMTDDERGFAYIPLGTSAGITGDMRKACGAQNAAFVDEAGTLRVAFGGVEHTLCKTSELKIVGSHNHINALAAASAALSLGADEKAVSDALKTFAPLEHRIEPVGKYRGVEYYNDSKATNVDATLQALKAFMPRRPIVMLGGDDKGTDLAELVESCRRHVKAIVCYGEGGPRFYQATSVIDDMPVKLVKTFDEAFDAATALAQDGDIVLLSPACASFDEFTCFEERGEHFKQLVARLGD